jgi:hypothetical protein
MRDPNANSHETPMDLPDADAEELEFIVAWLGDKKEENLTTYFGIKERGWYVIFSSALSPLGPFNTSKEAHDSFFEYVGGK